MRATFGPRIRRVVVVALLAAGATLVGASAAQAQDGMAQTADFTWISNPNDFTWISNPNDFTWISNPNDFTWISNPNGSTSIKTPDDFTWI